MTETQRKARLERLRALVKGQPEEELRTQWAAVVAEIDVLEAAAPKKPTVTRKATASRDRKKRGGHDRAG